ncbi:MAG: hypothetical protein HY925_09685 [Elusimicrobia bacterium]|nr:hypothetical protein [Elusimicrobiota bacterium]
MHPYEKLEDMKVASPCSAKWSDMKGDDKVRHCDLCGLNVYNLSALKRKNAEELIQKKEGRLCVRFYMRSDGTVLTADCPVGLRKVRIRLAKCVGALVALLAIVGLGAWARRTSRFLGLEPELSRPLMGDVMMGALPAAR